VGGFHHAGKKLATRFGFDVDRLPSRIPALTESSLEVTGIHFHLDGPSVGQRVAAIEQSLTWVNRLRHLGHPVAFLDIGGGIPVRYIDSPDQWSAFCHEHRRALRNQRPPITFDNHPLGWRPEGEEWEGRGNVYPAYQSPFGNDWLATLLDAPLAGHTVSQQLSAHRLQLRSEPGRSLLDGCGLTCARVEFRKPISNGDQLIGLSMNHTQCRTTHDEFLIDPLVIAPHRDPKPDAVAPRSGFLVGAYCTESEFLCWRRLHFPCGIERGDLVVFPNTAGYLMHFMESRSHQFPLAQNIVREEAKRPSVPPGPRYILDPIDRPDDR
jgi:diaminopimelate decarboxylase